MVEYTIDDIRGPTVAREMAQLKTFVLEKFNGAIADAEAAAAAAATAAANAVIGSLTSRVTALEGDMTTAQGDIITNANAILALDSAAVKLAGAQTISGIKQVPLEATGTASNQIASSQKVKNELDNYAPMVRTTGNQNVAGVKTFTNNIEIKAGKNSKLSIYTNTNQGETPTTPSVTDIEFYRGTTYSGRIAESIEADGSASVDIMIKANQLSNKEGRIQMYEDIANLKFVLRFWNGNTWTVLG